nr:hypothetical protein CFP56_09967 [Quercus suber]
MHEHFTAAPTSRNVCPLRVRERGTVVLEAAFLSTSGRRGAWRHGGMAMGGDKGWRHLPMLPSARPFPGAVCHYLADTEWQQAGTPTCTFDRAYAGSTSETSSNAAWAIGTSPLLPGGPGRCT